MDGVVGHYQICLFRWLRSDVNVVAAAFCAEPAVRCADDATGGTWMIWVERKRNGFGFEYQYRLTGRCRMGGFGVVKGVCHSVTLPCMSISLSSLRHLVLLLRPRWF